MTREEAIIRFERQLKAAQVVLDSGFGSNPGESDRLYRERKEMAEIALAALRGPTREQVEKAWRGEWKHYLPPLGAGDVQCRCTNCGRTPDVETPFCAWCGRAMTDEAVDIMLKRLEALKDD